MTHEIQVESRVKSVATTAGASGMAGRRRDDFLAVLSHELRTPLHAVLGWVEILEREVAFDVRVRALKAIKRNATAMRRIVEDLSDQSRIDTGKLRLALKVTDLRALLAEAVNAVRPTAEKQQVHIELSVPHALPLIQADPGRLLQVLSNLLSNAVKFTPVNGKVDVCAEATPQCVRIVVSDTGCGIDQKLLPYLFIRFHQGENAQARAQGLGLGLPLVKELVERHGGQVFAESGGVGKGAKFTVVLPFSARKQADRHIECIRL